MKWTALLLITVAACGPSMRGDDDDFGGDGGNHGSNGSNGSNGGDGCSDASKLIYVVDSNNQLSQFDPTQKAFHDLGVLNCPAGTGFQPFSMGVDRNATAYVLYVDQTGTSTKPKLFKVDTQTSGLPCTATTFNSPATLAEFGMGFSTTTAGGDVDELYVAGSNDPTATQPATLYKLDVTQYSTMSLGSVGGSPELTGNANAELWGFFPSVTDIFSGNTSTAYIEQINKTSGTSVSMANLPASMQGAAAAWAFAFYGGDYWVFLKKMTDTSTTVYQVTSSGALMGMTAAPGRTIVGAGVSTCAPVVIGRR